MTQFSNRKLLSEHLDRGQLCLLNTVLRMPPLSSHVEDLVNQREKAAIASRVSAGYCAHKTEFPCFHLYGPMQPIIDIHGTVISYFDKRHPRGPGKPKRIPPDFPDFYIPDEILGDDIGELPIAV